MSESDLPSSAPVLAHGVEGRLRLAVRWARFGASSLAHGDFDYAANAMRAEARLVARSTRDVIRRHPTVSCNICGWVGGGFYPNTGSGFDEPDSLCPGCRGLDRHRSMLALLETQTDFFAAGTRVVEVAPTRGFQALCQARPELDYTSFDQSRFAMEEGDITAMRFDDGSVDWFVCFHVIEHILDEAAAMNEIRRVLRPGGRVVLQVPVDWDQAATREFDEPDRRDAGHVRHYGRDFSARMAAHGFVMDRLEVTGAISETDITVHGMSREPIFVGRRPD